MSDTPRTDEELDQARGPEGFIAMINHSKKLERELAAMTKECAELNNLLRIYCSENIEDKLRESLKLPPRSQP